MFYGSGNENLGRSSDIGPRPTPDYLISNGWTKTRGGNFKHPKYSYRGCTLDSAQNIIVGAWLRKTILETVPPLHKAIEAAQEEAESGYVIGIDGRKLHMRQSFGKIQIHKALNTKLQSLGAILMSKATEFLFERANAEGLRWELICFYHDEWSMLAHPDDAKRVGEISVQAIRDAGEFFNLNVPMDGEDHYGCNWAETH